MEAHILRSAVIIAALGSLGANYPGPAGSYRTQNFIISASSAQFAKQVGDAAEQYRRELAIEWLGKELPPWPAPCPIRVHDGPQMGAGGATEYTPTRNGVRDFRMQIQGSQVRILDSVLPHEVTHTILASHFGQPLPRWADEGACTTVEHASEKNRHEKMLRSFLATNRGIPMNRMFLMRDYPRDILPLYAQGFSVSRFLIEQGGRRKFVDFVGEVLEGSQWTHAVQRNYGYESLRELQEHWLGWVENGSGSVEQFVKNTTPATPDPASIATASATGPIAQVSAAAPLSPAPGPNAQVSATAPLSPAPGPSASPAPLASTASSDGWYLRRRKEVAAKETPENATPRSFEKKHLRGHTISRPQPMQGIPSAGIPWTGAPTGTILR